MFQKILMIRVSHTDSVGSLTTPPLQPLYTSKPTQRSDGALHSCHLFPSIHTQLYSVQLEQMYDTLFSLRILKTHYVKSNVKKNCILKTFILLLVAFEICPFELELTWLIPKTGPVDSGICLLIGR